MTLPITRTAWLCCVAGLIALLPCLEAAAQVRKRVPRFEDYPVTQVRSGPSVEPILKTEGQRDGIIYYRAVAEAGANFAGHYAVVMLTCGRGCSTVEFLDTRTGRITPGAFANSEWQEQHHDAFRDVEFRRDSRLIVFAGLIDEREPNGWHFYLFDRGRLRRLHTIATGGDFRKPLSEWMYPQRSKAASTGTR